MNVIWEDCNPQIFLHSGRLVNLYFKTTGDPVKRFVSLFGWVRRSTLVAIVITGTSLFYADTMFAQTLKFHLTRKQ